MSVVDERLRLVVEGSRAPHRGVFITGPDRLELLEDELPAAALDGGEHILTASLGNCRCASDTKAIRQFTAHARVPQGADRVALGHETVQQVVAAPDGSGLAPGDLVFVTPGHSSRPVDPADFADDPERGVLCALGYSYRHFGGLRRFNAIPRKAIELVAGQGFGELFNKVAPRADVSLASLAHAEPFACNYGTNKHVFTIGPDGTFRYGIPPRARIAYLGGTARMAMINLTIVASVPDHELPETVYVTGSRAKLDQLDGFALIRRLRDQGTRVVTIDRRDPAIVDRLLEHGPSEIVFANYASQEVYDQAAAIIAPGGNLNNYAGASDESLVIQMPVGRAEPIADPAVEARRRIAGMHHNRAPNDPERYRGIARGGVVRLVGLERTRAEAFVAELPQGTAVSCDQDLVLGDHVRAADDGDRWTDLFVAGEGDAAERAYAAEEPNLARSAAVCFVAGPARPAINSRRIHYTTRHQICGDNVPWHLTNTSEPVAEDMARHAAAPIDFDWMVRGVAGLGDAIAMMRHVEEHQPFGSFFTLVELEDLPFVAVDADAFRAAAERSAGRPAAMLAAGAEVLERNGGVWSREVEEALYAAAGIPHPLSEATR